MNVRTSGRAAILSLLCLPTILSAADVEELAGLPVIGGIPTSPAEFVLAARDEPSLMRIAPGEDSIYSGFAQIFADDVPIGPAPHTPWARPLAGERLRVLVVSELHANHDVAELVRALDADYRHAFVPFMYHYPTSNPEFYAEDACFPVRARQALSEGPDVIVAPAVSRLLGDQFAQQVLEKVRAGAGLVLIGGGRFGGGGQYRFWTFENDTPEAWRELDLVDAVNGRFQHSPEPSVSPDAGIFTDVPFSMLPGHHLFDLDLAEGAEALACDGNLPLLVTGTVGKGRVVLLPWAHWWGPFPIEEKNRQPELLPYQEYYASAVAKAILYAANRTAAVGVHVATKTIEAGKPGNASVQIDPVPEPAQVCFNTAAPYGEDLVNGARSFYDGPIMSWSGYGRDSSQYERYVWVMALQGHWSLGWWYGSCFYHPWDCWYPQATWVNTMTRPLRDGAGDLLLLNRPILSEPIAFLYSQPSLYAMGVLGQEVNPNNPNLLVRPAQWARISLQRMLQDQGVQFRFVSEEQLQKGQCGGLKLLILSSCVAIEPETAKAVRAFVEQGGIVLADLSPGVFDDHGVPQSPGLLDELFGVEHTARFHLKTDIAEWGIGTHHAPPELPIDGQWFIGQYYEDTLRVADGRAIGKHVFDPDGVPARWYGQFPADSERHVGERTVARHASAGFERPDRNVDDDSGRSRLRRHRRSQSGGKTVMRAIGLNCISKADSVAAAFAVTRIVPVSIRFPASALTVSKCAVVVLAVLFGISGTAADTVSFGDPPGDWHIEGLTVHRVDGTLTIRAEPGATGQLENAALPLVALHRYRLTIESERGPGTEVRFELAQQLADGAIYQRNVVFMLPDEIRPGHWPLSPYRNTYVAGFALLPDTKRAKLKITIKGSLVPELAYFRLHGLKIDDLGEVPFSDRPGKNLMPFGEIRGELGDPLPKYWSQWVHTADENQKLVDDGPRSAPLCFSVDAPDKWLLLVCPDVPIEVGRAYRIVVHVRGKGSIGLAAHVLGRPPFRPRVGDPQSRIYQVDSPHWQRLEHVWFADAIHGLVAQVYFHTNGNLDLDDVAFELIPPRDTQ